MYDAIQHIINVARFELPGATDAAIHMALFDAFDEWCKQAEANKLVIAQPIQVNVRYYEVTLPETYIISVLKVGHSNNSLSMYYDNDSNQLVLRNAPTVDDAVDPVYMEVATAPKYGSTDFDSWMMEGLWQRHARTILSGVIATMAAQIAKPYSNQNKAVFHGRRFRRYIASDKAQSNVGYSRNGQAWHFPIVK